MITNTWKTIARNQKTGPRIQSTVSRNWREKMPPSRIATSTTATIGATNVAIQRPSGALVRKPSSFSRAMPIAPSAGEVADGGDAQLVAHLRVSARRPG